MHGPEVERDLRNPLYEEVLEDALSRLNPALPQDALAEALNKLKNIENGSLVQKNAVFMDYLQNGMLLMFSYIKRHTPYFLTHKFIANKNAADSPRH